MKEVMLRVNNLIDMMRVVVMMTERKVTFFPQHVCLLYLNASILAEKGEGERERKVVTFLQE